MPPPSVATPAVDPNQREEGTARSIECTCQKRWQDCSLDHHPVARIADNPKLAQGLQVQMLERLKAPALCAPQSRSIRPERFWRATAEIEKSRRDRLLAAISKHLAPALHARGEFDTTRARSFPAQVTNATRSSAAPWCTLRAKKWLARWKTVWMGAHAVGCTPMDTAYVRKKLLQRIDMTSRRIAKNLGDAREASEERCAIRSKRFRPVFAESLSGPRGINLGVAQASHRHLTNCWKGAIADARSNCHWKPMWRKRRNGADFGSEALTIRDKRRFMPR